MRKLVVTIFAAAFLAACATNPKPPVTGPAPAARQKEPAPKRPPVKNAAGYMVCKSGGYTADFYGAQNLKITAKAGEQKEMPAGKYDVANLTWTFLDKDGKAWTLQRQGPVCQIEILPGQTVELAAGPPFKLSVIAAKAAGSVDFQPSIKGAAGETYPISGIKNGSGSIPQPKVKVVEDGSGKILADNAFRFG
jgi:hypothetical protein